jgi:hypothetical protein
VGCQNGEAGGTRRRTCGKTGRIIEVEQIREVQATERIALVTQLGPADPKAAVARVLPVLLKQNTPGSL